MTKILIVDDHQIVLDGLCLILRDFTDLNVVGTCTNGREAISWCRNNACDVILMDINMPEIDGITACKQIMAAKPDIHIIFLSMIDELDLMNVLRESGAKGYLLKNSGAAELKAAIDKVMVGGMYFDENVVEVETPKLKQRSIPKITPREREILALIVDEMSSVEIAKKLYLSVGTVQTHRKNLISKLDVKNTAGLVRKALKFDLINT